MRRPLRPEPERATRRPATFPSAEGAYYRVDQAALIQNNASVENFPSRLRGVFGFATLTNGNIMPIDVDDFDAPCHRCPDPMAPPPASWSGTIFQGQTGALDFPEPPSTGPNDLDEYHAPTRLPIRDLGRARARRSRPIYPVSAPHRDALERRCCQDDPNSGPHIPGLVNIPRLFDQNGSPVQTGSGVPETPLILPTQLSPGFVDPSQGPGDPAETGPAALLRDARGPCPRHPACSYAHARARST